MLKSLGGAPDVHPLGETYHTQTACRFGDWIAKLSLVPVSDNLRNLAGGTISALNRPDALREEVDAAMQDAPAERGCASSSAATSTRCRWRTPPSNGTRRSART